MSGNTGSGTPWIHGGLHIPRSLLTEVSAHAVEQYPSECCGFLLGPADPWQQCDVVAPQINEADKYHALDPVTFPRTSNTYFKMNELKATRAFQQGVESGRPVKVIYHSHCDAGAYFSAEDAATFAAGDQLMWPCAFLVTSVQEGKVTDHKLWRFDPPSQKFVQAEFTLTEP